MDSNISLKNSMMLQQEMEERLETLTKDVSRSQRTPHGNASGTGANSPRKQK
jgi:hypothetical protein